MTDVPSADNQCMTGVQQFRTPLYGIKKHCIACWWWGHRTEFSIETDFISIGGFKTADEAHSAARACGFVAIETN